MVDGSYKLPPTARQENVPPGTDIQAGQAQGRVCQNPFNNLKTNKADGDLKLNLNN